MSALVTVILPVFLVIGFGFAAARLRLFGADAVEGLMRYAQSFAVPVLLAVSIARLDLSADFSPPLLAAFYGGAFASYAAGWAGARFAFGRSPADAVAIGFVCLFSNSLLLGVPITERAFGEAALAGNWTIVAIHSPLLYTFGITVMEFTRARGSGVSPLRVAGRALRGVLQTALVIGILTGLAVNLGQRAGLAVPEPVWSAAEMVARSALPAALFGLGGVLSRYRPEGDAGVIAMAVACALVLHPAVTWTLGRGLGVDQAGMRSAVVTAAMAPGVNAYLFANLYGAGRRVAASSVLVGTVASILTAAFWLGVVR